MPDSTSSIRKDLGAPHADGDAEGAWIKLTQITQELGRGTRTPLTRVDVAGLVGTVLRPAQQSDELGRLAGFRILDILGQGGMGLVFRAEDVGLRREVALKILHPASTRDATARERFLREAQAAAALHHDHIVPIFQVGEDAGVLFLAMPLLRGCSLDDWLHRHGPGSWPQVFRLGREVLSGLAAAHAAGLVHRDIKPGNLWLEAPRGRVKILDFGLARQMGSSGASHGGRTTEGVVVGTPDFMSPEQMMGEPLDARSDLFAVGLVLFRLASGQTPLAGLDYYARLAALSARKMPMLRSLRADVPPELERFLTRLLAVDSEARPASAQQAATELAAIEAAWLAAQQQAGLGPDELRLQADFPISQDPPGSVPDPHSSLPSTGPQPGRGSWLVAALLVAAVSLLGLIALVLFNRAGRDPSSSLASGAAPPQARDGADAGSQPRARPSHPVRPTDAVPARFTRLARVPEAELSEASALIRSRRQPGIYFTVRDANNPPNFYAVDLTGRLRGVFTPENSTNVDWEAITADEQGDLYIGDIGNNHMRVRPRVIYRVREPEIPASWKAGQLAVSVPVVARFLFTADKVFDSETLFFLAGRLYLVTKERDQTPPALYHLPLDKPGRERPMEFVTTLDSGLLAVADGAVSPSGLQLALVSRHGCAVYRLEEGQDVKQLGRLRPRVLAFDLFKIEGCAWEDENHLILIGEDRVIYRLSVD